MKLAPTLLVAALAAASLTCLADDKTISSQFAGSWYPGDKASLESEIRQFMDKASLPAAKPGNVVALVQPHAGYRYSGPTAAHGAKLIQGRDFKRVVVMGPSHRAHLKNQVRVPSCEFFSTPLGKVPVDNEFIAGLKGSPIVRADNAVLSDEHSVQMQIPFLQQALKGFKLVPIVVGSLDDKTSTELAALLVSLLDPSTLVVVSSDFTHYGLNYGYVPFSRDVEANLAALDMGAFEEMKKISPKGFESYVAQKKATICGAVPITVLLKMLDKDRSSAALLNYATSGKMTGDFSNSVSYLSVAFSGKWAAQAGKAEPSPADTRDAAFSDDERRALLKIARLSIELYIKKRETPNPERLGVEITPRMSRPSGVFVTLHKDGELRGCVGEIMPRRPLVKAVAAQAVNSAFNDRRFFPVAAGELKKIEIEISALTPPVDVSSAKDIVIGKHGIILTKDDRSAVFLPQVATEQGWNLETTLTHLARKASLPPDAWKSGAKFSVFEAVVFREGDYAREGE